MKATAIIAAATLAGCFSVEREERPCALGFASAPGATVHVRPVNPTVTADPSEVVAWRSLGSAPVEVTGLVIVRKEFVSGSIDYWLEDRGAALPPHPDKPSFASRPYIVGNDYPLLLDVEARRPGVPTATSRVRIDAADLERAYGEGKLTFEVPFSSPRGAAGGPKPSAAPPKSIPR